MPNVSLKFKSRLNKLRSDGNFNLLLKASSFNAIVKLAGTAFGFLASFLIARHYGPGLVGQLATLTSTFTLLSLFALFGNQTLTIKIIPEYVEKYGHTTAKIIYFKLLTITLFFTTGVIAIWYLIEFLTPLTFLRGLEQYAILVAVLIFIAANRRINTQALRGLGDYKIYSYFQLLLPVLLALTAITAIFFKIPEQNLLYMYFMPQLVVCILSFYFVNKTFYLQSRDSTAQQDSKSLLPTSYSLIKSSFPMFGVTISTAIIAHFDILMLNYFTSSATVGIYAIYAKIIIITSLATSSINAMFAPTVSKLFAAKNLNELKIFAKKTTLLSFSLSLALILIFILIHKPFLSLYGQEFLKELPTLYVLIFCSLISSFFGPVGLYLNMTGHQSSFFRIIFLAALMNIVINALLIPVWGSPGAAVATLICVVTWNILATRKVLREFGYTIVWSGGLCV